MPHQSTGHSTFRSLFGEGGLSASEVSRLTSWSHLSAQALPEGDDRRLFLSLLSERLADESRNKTRVSTDPLCHVVERARSGAALDPATAAEVLARGLEFAIEAKRLRPRSAAEHDSRQSSSPLDGANLPGRELVDPRSVTIRDVEWPLEAYARRFVSDEWDTDPKRYLAHSLLGYVQMHGPGPGAEIPEFLERSVETLIVNSAVRGGWQALGVVQEVLTEISAMGPALEAMLRSSRERFSSERYAEDVERSSEQRLDLRDAEGSSNSTPRTRL